MVEMPYRTVGDSMVGWYMACRACGTYRGPYPHRYQVREAYSIHLGHLPDHPVIPALPVAAPEEDSR